MTKLETKRKMSVLFDSNNIVNDSRSSRSQCLGEMASSVAVQLKNVEELEEKVKHREAKKEEENLPPQNIDVDLVTIPSLESEDDESVSGDPVDDDSTTTATNTNTNTNTDCQDHNIESKSKKRRRKNTELSDLVVVLDMDECLIHFIAQENEIKCESSECNSEDKVEEDRENIAVSGATKGHSKVMHVNNNKVLLRPGLIDFLKFVTTRFETHIFTAGTKDYADSILDQLCLLVGDQDAFSKRWYREDCDTIDILDPFTAFCIDSIYVKPLSKVAEWVGRDAEDLRRIVHVDDQARNFLLNHGNGIRVSEWRGDNPDDSALSEVTKVLQHFDGCIVGDVRPYLRNESYLSLKDHLDMMTLFPHRRTKGIVSAFL